MARKRHISPRFFANEALSDIDPLGRILFAGLWCFSDRNGRMEYRPKRIKAEILPYDGTVDDVIRWLNELALRGFIQFYVIDKQRYIQITNFSRYQSPHPEEKPLFPDFNENHLLATCQQPTSNLLESGDKATGNGQATGQEVASSLPATFQPPAEPDLPTVSAKIREQSKETKLRLVPGTIEESAISESNLPTSYQQVADNLQESCQQSFNSNHDFNSNVSESGPMRGRAREGLDLTALPGPNDSFDSPTESLEPNVSPVERALCAAVGWIPERLDPRQYRAIRQAGQQIAAHPGATPERIARAPDFYRAQGKWSFAPSWIAGDWAQISAWIEAQDRGDTDRRTGNSRSEQRRRAGEEARIKLFGKGGESR